MSKFYDVTFHEVSGKAIVKRQILSEHAPFEAWKDACETISEDALNIRVNEDTYVQLTRKFIVRIDVVEVDGPVDKQIKRHDELMGVVNTLSNMGL
ncbi:hypothetical protein ACYSNW_09590 [Enterococcus sp. LJL99]